MAYLGRVFFLTTHCGLCDVPAAVISEEEKEEMMLDLVDRNSSLDPRQSN